MHLEIETVPTAPEPGTVFEAFDALEASMGRKDDCESFVLIATQFVDMFFQSAIGYWAMGIEQSSDKGWLVYEHGGRDVPGVRDRASAVRKWKNGGDLGARWLRLDRAAATRAYLEGVRRWGVGWYRDRSDASSYDCVLQVSLLGEVRYG